jgi:hypothetical protein
MSDLDYELDLIDDLRDYQSSFKLIRVTDWDIQPIGVIIGTELEIRCNCMSMAIDKTYLYDGYTALELLE